MRIIAERTIREYYERNPQSKTALEDWVAVVKKSQWRCFADIKATFNTVDYVGNQHYVFNIKGLKRLSFSCFYKVYTAIHIDTFYRHSC